MSQIKDILVIIAILAVVLLAVRLGDITGYVVSTATAPCNDIDEKATFYYKGERISGFEASLFYKANTKGRYTGYAFGGIGVMRANLQDYCINGNVNEFYCDGTFVKEMEVSCPIGYYCSDGHCISG